VSKLEVTTRGTGDRGAPQVLTNAVPGCLVRGYEDLIDTFKLDDPDDGHVAAAAVKAGAQVIVTRDGRGFPQSFLDEHDICLKDPDDFVADLIDLPRAGPLMHQIVTDGRRLRSACVRRHLETTEEQDGVNTDEARSLAAMNYRAPHQGS
jgi:hypothetical protein